ncbi:hypothetical protein OSB04_015425 [Centaurea solstitialis]|uniref:CCHC-type domain-containing protein n=1 Tax=Centaurea solstitialis TaxID=347529 RepID=A0AA38TAZ9_9ASTR|nr:hypothetical protein OSB04_015425 [Centaurea solstitialis]
MSYDSEQTAITEFRLQITSMLFLSSAISLTSLMVLCVLGELDQHPPANAAANVRNAYRKHSDDLLDVGCLMLATMSPDLQTGLINTNAYDMIRQLRDMFQTQARTERYDATRALNACKMAKGTSISDHVMKMKRHIDHLERLGHPVPLQLATDTILNSLSEDYKQFVINYNMNNMEKTIAELHSMLKTAELGMGTGTKTKNVLMVRDGGVKRKCGHGNTSKGKSQPQASQSVTKVENNDERKGKSKKVKPNKTRTENRCFRCHELGHWRQNCPKCHKAGNNASGKLIIISNNCPPLRKSEIEYYAMLVEDHHYIEQVVDRRTMDNGFIASLQQQLQEANNEIQRLRALPGPSMTIPMSIPPQYPPQHLRPPPRPQFNASMPFPTVNQQYDNVRPSLPQFIPPIPHGPPPMPRGPPSMPQGAPMFTFEPFSQQIPIPGHIPTAASSTIHTTIPPSTGIASSCIPTNPINVEDPLNVRLKSLEEQNQKLFALLTKLPGAAVPVEVEPKTGFQASPFVDELALVDVPKKYTIPAFATKYSGITDPVEHIAQYKQLMWTVPIPAQYQEVCMCKSFGSTLTGAALQWLINLKPKSIGSFAELVNQFTRQFASSRKMEKQTSDLYYIVQKSGETIRDYFNRFNAAMIEIKNCDVKTAIEAYKRGLEDSSGLYLELTKYPPENFDDVRARTLAFMRIEDDALFRRKHSAEKKPLGAQKHDFKHKRVNKIGNPRYESKTRPSKGTVKIRYPELSTYNFAGTSKDLVDSLRKIDANVRWPKKSDKPSKDKDQNRWCDFHDDHGHTTDECISLKKEISYLKSKGHLKGLIPEEQGRPASPVHTKVINCITGGSEVCGLTYSAAKRHARDGPSEHPIPEKPN